MFFSINSCPLTVWIQLNNIEPVGFNYGNPVDDSDVWVTITQVNFEERRMIKYSHGFFKRAEVCRDTGEN